jgi:hypothetical protein
MNYLETVPEQLDALQKHANDAHDVVTLIAQKFPSPEANVVVKHFHQALLWLEKLKQCEAILFQPDPPEAA